MELALVAVRVAAVALAPMTRFAVVAVEDDV
jgi:hypothetical protein